MKPFCFLIALAISGLMLAIVLFFSTSSIAQTPPDQSTNWRVERLTLDGEFADRLEDVANWCGENNVSQKIPETLGLCHPRDPGRQYIFLPSEQSNPTPTGGVLGLWLTKINEVKTWQAERIFEMAKRAAAENSANAAFQLLNEVLYFDKDHAEVRKILGHRKTDDGWRVAPDRVHIRPASRDHDICQWPAKSFWLVTTPNFEIESNASEEQIRYLAEKLERWHGVWRQVFFEYWSSASNLKRWIDGKAFFRLPRKRFRVVFFQQRDDYLRQLSQRVRGVEVSSGYYSSEYRVSFFYDDTDRTVEDTWRHELTHQLFRESINTGDDLFEDEFIWLDEGIATYFESLTDFGDYVTLGGFESRRMQYARIRRFLEKFHVPLAELSEIGRTDLQNRPDMAPLYSESAGVIDMLMNDRNGAMEPKLTEFLKLIFTGRRIKPGTFEKLMGSSYAELDARYEEYLHVDAHVVAQHLALPSTRTEMSLSGAKLNDADYEALGKCQNLNWIDLSRNPITSARISKLERCQNLMQLFLNECLLEPGALSQLQRFKKLEELDLSGSSVVDSQLEELSGLSGLKNLRLINARITDAGLAALDKLPQLRWLNVTGTGVSDAGVAGLKQKLPHLEVTR